MIRWSRGTLIWSNSDTTIGLNEFLLAEAFLAMCVHVGGSWGDEMSGGSEWRESTWPWSLTSEQGQHVLEKPPNMNNNNIIHVRTKALPLKSFVGFVKAGKYIT